MGFEFFAKCCGRDTTEPTVSSPKTPLMVGGTNIQASFPQYNAMTSAGGSAQVGSGGAASPKLTAGAFATMKR